jgi:large subunit ribosomal protein L17
MLRNMATSLFESGAIITTLSKAKAVKPVVDRLITLAKRGDLHSIRLARAILTKTSVLRTLFGEAKEKFADRICGYASVVRVGLRAGDAAPLARLELLGPDSVKAEIGHQTAVKKATDRGRRVAATKTKVTEKSPQPTASPALTSSPATESAEVENPEPESPEATEGEAQANDPETAPTAEDKTPEESGS